MGCPLLKQGPKFVLHCRWMHIMIMKMWLTLMKNWTWRQWWLLLRGRHPSISNRGILNILKFSMYFLHDFAVSLIIYCFVVPKKYIIGLWGWWCPWRMYKIVCNLTQIGYRAIFCCCVTSVRFLFLPMSPWCTHYHGQMAYFVQPDSRKSIFNPVCSFPSSFSFRLFLKHCTSNNCFTQQWIHESLAALLCSITQWWEISLAFIFWFHGWLAG